MLKLKLQYFGHPIQRTDSWRRPWCWDGLGTGAEGDNRGWDGWMASPTQWTWVWASSGWWTGKPGLLQSMGSQRVWNNWATELNWRISTAFENLFPLLFSYLPAFLVTVLFLLFVSNRNANKGGWNVSRRLVYSGSEQPMWTDYTLNHGKKYTLEETGTWEPQARTTKMSEP